MIESHLFGRNYPQQKTQIMGILNVTPDSFSDGGQYNQIDLATHRALEMVEQGATIIDIGGESTRPGASSVSQEEELARVIPIIHAVRKHTQVAISIDTYKSEVARQALFAGATIINDVWGGMADPLIWDVAVQFRCPYILTHNREQAGYHDIVPEMIQDLQKSVDRACRAGIQKSQIILDPGIGFAKSTQDNLKVMDSLEHIVALGFPVLLGTSRKKFIRDTLGRTADDVIEGTAVTIALGIYKGCNIVRVHDVAAMQQVVTMTEAIRDYRSISYIQ
jgi:dihydropteroate synthase